MPFHIVLCSTKHWQFDVKSVNVLTSMAATLSPCRALCFPKAWSWQGLFSMAGTLTWGKYRTPFSEARLCMALPFAAAHQSPQSL